MIALDRTDLAILAQLQRDARLTNQELADRVALSPSPCLRRVRRLEEAGVIRAQVALLDARSIGLGLTAFVSVRLEKRLTPQGGSGAGRPAYEDFHAAVQDWPEVVACLAMTGDTDYLLRVEAADLDAFSAFVLERLLRHRAVLDVRSSFVMERIKETTALPLAQVRQSGGDETRHD